MPAVSDLDPDMREAVDRARAIITAMAQGFVTNDFGLVDRLTGEFEAELVALDDRAAAADRAGKLVHALAHLAVFVASLPSLIFDELDVQSALSSAFILVAGMEADE